MRPRQPEKYFPAMPDTTQLISYHGGHSGEFCAHAQDQLEDVIRRYIELGFQTVGISEHMPPEEDRFVYDDEHLANLDIDKMQNPAARLIETLPRTGVIYLFHLVYKMIHLANHLHSVRRILFVTYLH